MVSVFVDVYGEIYHMLKKSIFVAAMVALGISGEVISVAQARDQIRIVGSSTVFPFSTTVAEQFGKTSPFKTPIVESTGSGGGLKLFCAGIGDKHPDMTNASRRIKKSEISKCAKNGVRDIIEVKIGYDGIVFANSQKAELLKVSLKDIYFALAKNIPTTDGKIIPNPHKIWSDVNPALPARKIEVLGPPPTSGTRDAFVELAMEGGCKSVEWVKKLKKKNKSAYKSLCHAIREDRVFIEAGENDNLIVQKLGANPNAFGIFGYSFLDQNADRLQGSPISDQAPTFENIADGKYPISRPLYFYVKKAHIGKVPGIREFMTEFTSERAWGNEGYLSEKGMIPMSDKERNKFMTNVRELQNLAM
jgi:phosphate transport system substrate-binding protein